MLDKHLRYFIELVKLKNYTRASETLFVSQSTVSKAVSSLEKELDAKLVRIDKGEFILTREGELLYEFALDVTEYYDKKEYEFLQEVQNLGGKLSLGLPPTAGSIYFFEKISIFKNKYSDIDLEIKNETSKYLPEMLLDHKLDLGVVIEPFDDDRFVKNIVYESEAVLVVSQRHRFSHLEEIEFSLLKDERFLQISEDYQYYQVFEDYCKKANFEPNIIFKNYEWDMILEMVAANVGVTIMPKPLVTKYFSSRVKLIRLKNPIFPWALTLIYLKEDFLTKEMQKFISICSS
ncbi:LysR family transcriptional regulator [Anaerococcus urinomassiliensis]|uniref:LysR family transcriptional regulator n=1 Tax=Anaerococcus urinomassiliensis TaxID=1745712 RepID=UPI00093943D4|nr:LysR family transcriptional regulator [Anaerococcus urinomassiliensis]